MDLLAALTRGCCRGTMPAGALVRAMGPSCTHAGRFRRFRLGKGSEPSGPTEPVNTPQRQV